MTSPTHETAAPDRRGLGLMAAGLIGSSTELGAGLLSGTDATFCIRIAGVLDHATRELGVDRDELLAVTVTASAISVLVIYFSWSLSDRVGRRPPILVGAAVIALWAFLSSG